VKKVNTGEKDMFYFLFAEEYPFIHQFIC